MVAEACRAFGDLDILVNNAGIIHAADFLMGVAAARLYDHLQPRIRSGALFYLPAAALSAALIARPDWLPAAIDLNTALRPLNAAFLIGLALGGGAAARALGSRLAVYLGKVSFLRVRLSVGDEGLVAGLTGNQGSGVLSSCVAADGLAVVPADHRELPQGSPVQVVLLREDLAWVS